MFPKHRFHEIMKPALDLFRHVFAAQGDVHHYVRKSPESQVIYDIFEELKAGVEERFQKFRERAGDEIPEGQVEAAANRFKEYYDCFEKVTMVLCEYEDGWYREEIKVALKSMAAKVNSARW